MSASSKNLANNLDNITTLLQDAAAAFDCTVLTWEHFSNRGDLGIKLIVDNLTAKTARVDLNTCERLSRHLAAVLLAQTQKEYSLEISSPGINCRLYSVLHAAKHQDQQLECILNLAQELASGFEGKKFLAKLLDVNLSTGDLSLELIEIAGKALPAPEIKTWNFADFEKLVVVPDWRAALKQDKQSKK